MHCETTCLFFGAGGVNVFLPDERGDGEAVDIVSLRITARAERVCGLGHLYRFIRPRQRSICGVAG